MISNYNKTIKKKQMRDILNILDTINEEVTLMPSQLKKHEDRFQTFVDHIAKGLPFYTSATVNGMPPNTEVILDPAEAKRFADLYNQNRFEGPIVGKDKEGNQWPISKFKKTKEFGGESLKPSDTAETIGKEAAGLKPNKIGITDQPFKASQLGQVIINNPVLKSTPHGQVVIECAKAIMAGQTPTLPKEILVNKQLTAAITDNAGEYLGVLALLHGLSDFPNQADFLKWLGGSLGNLTLFFPSNETNNLADSFATIINPTTEQQINISSKGTGGGAAPALSGLVVPEHLKKKRSFRTAIDLIELTQNTKLPAPATISQVFQAMNLLWERVPDAIPAQFKPFLPWPRTIIDEVNSSRNAPRGTRVDLPEYAPLFSNLKSTGTDGGKLTYVVKKTVSEIVNSGAVPGFQAAILEILDYNFIQQYTKLASKKTGALAFNTQWPAKLNGHVTMEAKSSATDPTGGGFCFKLGQTNITKESDETIPAPVVYLGTEQTLGRPRQK
jgi:hypothetical protein